MRPGKCSLFTSSLGRTRVCVQHPSTPAICGGLLSCLKFIRRWIPKGMLPHFGRKIHHLHGISRTHNQQTSPGESFAGGASNKWLWHRPPEHHCNPATAPYVSLFGVSSPSMRPQLGCHPRSPTIQVPQNKASENSWHGMEWHWRVTGFKCINAYDTYTQKCIHSTIRYILYVSIHLTSLVNSWEAKSVRENLGSCTSSVRDPVRVSNVLRAL